MLGPLPSRGLSCLAVLQAAIAAINKTDKVVFNNCGIGCSPSEGVDSRDPRPWAPWCRENANTWRSSGDINVQSWRSNLASLIGRGALSQPGGWNYPDSLEVGNCHRTACIHGAEARAHFSLWCITSSPLYLGMRLDNISDADLARPWQTVSQTRLGLCELPLV